MISLFIHFLLTLIFLLSIYFIVTDIIRKEYIKTGRNIRLDEIDFYILVLISANFNAKLAISRMTDYDYLFIQKKCYNEKWFLEIFTENSKLIDTLKAKGLIHLNEKKKRLILKKLYFYDGYDLGIIEIKKLLKEVFETNDNIKLSLKPENLKISFENRLKYLE